MEKCFKEPFSLVDKVVKVVAQSVNHLETSRLFPPFIYNTYYCLRWAYFQSHLQWDGQHVDLVGIVLDLRSDGTLNAGRNAIICYQVHSVTVIDDQELADFELDLMHGRHVDHVELVLDLRSD
jgi:hypothetical protein